MRLLRGGTAPACSRGKQGRAFAHAQCACRGGAKKKDTDGAKAAGGSADAPEAKVSSKSPKKAAPRGAGKAEAKQQVMDDEVIEVKASGSKDATEQISTGSKRGERGVVDVDTTPSKKSRAAERFPVPSHVHEGEAESGGAVVQSKFFADSPTKAAAAAAKKRKERDVVEIASTDSDEDKGKDKGKKAATVTASHSAPAPDIGDLAAFASNGSANAGQPGEKLKGEKSPEKKKRALPSTLLKSEEAAASKTPQGKLNSPPSSTPPTKKPGEKTSDSKSSQQGAEQSPSAGGVPAEEAPKKKFNPWNQEKVEVPNKHLRDQKIADNRGKENCLAGMTFVITGVLDSMERDECADLIKSYGGKVTSGVSGKTSYLIVGTDAGQSKLDKARQKNCKTIDEDGLFGIIKASGPPTAAAAAPTSVLPAGATTSQTAPVHAGGAFKSSVSGKSAEKAPKSSVPSQTSSPLKKKDGNEHAAPSLWVDKWAPKGTEDLMGNGDKREQLRKWLVKWGSAEANSGAKAGGKAGAGGGKPDTVHKAVLMHGPPGIGKSSSARVMIETCGYTMIELNASDVRNKAGLQEKVASLTQNQSINALMKAQKKALQTFSGPKAGICVLCGKREREHFKGSAQQCYASFVEGPNGTSCHICGKPEDEHYGEHKQCYGTCLVMDEVDGMSSGDRGGVAELIQIIKNTRVPIICIANDGYNQKIKSLKNYCLELKFSKPMHTQVVKRLKMIAESEGFRVHNENALEKLYLGSGNDIRHVINALQTWRMRTSDIRYDDVAAERAGGGKDSSIQQTSAFDVVPRWFLSDSDHKDASFRDRLDMFFYDTDLMPLFVQENYVKVRVSLPRDESYSKDRGDYNIIRRMAEAADCISEADTVNDRIRKSQHWGLLPT